MSGVRDKDGVIHMPMVPGQLPFLIAHCDAIGSNHTGQTWKASELVDEKVTCVHCIADVRKSLGLEEAMSKAFADGLADAVHRYSDATKALTRDSDEP